MKTTSAADAKKVAGTTWVIYGVSGSGKTPLASCFPHPWVWDFEAGAKSMLIDTIPVSRMEGYGDILAAIQLLESCTPGKIRLGDLEYPFCSLVIDTLGEYCRALEGAAKGNKEQATLPEWYLTVERARKTTRQIRNTSGRGLNIVFVAHETYLKQAEIEVLAGLPDLPGKELPNDLPKLCDIVGHLQVKQGEKGIVRELVAEPHGVFIGRDRRGIISRLPIDLKNPEALQRLLVEKGGALHACGQEAIHG